MGELGGKDPYTWLCEKQPEWNIMASWLNDEGRPDHWMGGPNYKGGEGTRILLRPPTPEEVETSERQPKLELNSTE